MISSKEILEKTGLKSAKTLTRWYQQGLIPEPFVRTHPSGRGKIAYWEDRVLEQCMKIAELRKQGHSLRSTRALIQQGWIKKELKRVGKKEWLEKATLPLDAVLPGLILEQVNRLASDRDLQDALISKMDEEEAADRALDLLRSGYNPVLLFDGRDLQIIPDFLLGHRLADNATGRRPYLLVPLLPSLREAFSLARVDAFEEPNAFPAPKYWAKAGETTTEYEFILAGSAGFKVIRGTEKSIGTLPKELEREHEA